MYALSQTQRNHNARLPSNLILRHLHTYTTAKKAFYTFRNRGIQTVFLLYLNPLTTKHHIIDKYVPVLLLNIYFIVFCFIWHILDKCINRSIVMATSFRSSYQSFDFFSANDWLCPYLAFRCVSSLWQTMVTKKKKEGKMNTALNQGVYLMHILLTVKHAYKKVSDLGILLHFKHNS